MLEDGPKLTPIVDNVYVGHDAADAKKFAAETFHVKKPIEKEAEGSDSDEIELEAKTLLEKVQLKVYEFMRQFTCLLNDPLE
jgi:calnexin